MSENFANNFSTVLTGPLTATATTLSVASSTGAPAPNFRVVIDQEILLVTAVSGTSWTVERAQENTTAAAHLQGAQVQAEVTAASLSDLPYSPASQANWNNNPPGSVQAALDRIAAKVGPVT